MNKTINKLQELLNEAMIKLENIKKKNEDKHQGCFNWKEEFRQGSIKRRESNRFDNDFVWYFYDSNIKYCPFCGYRLTKYGCENNNEC